jgi:hypothetical protein
MHAIWNRVGFAVSSAEVAGAKDIIAAPPTATAPMRKNDRRDIAAAPGISINMAGLHIATPLRTYAM